MVMNSNNEISELPELDGVSGCGVWSIYDLFEERPKYELISIITGEDAQRTVLYSSRLDNFKKMLVNNFKVTGL